MNKLQRLERKFVDYKLLVVEVGYYFELKVNDIVCSHTKV